MRKVEIGPCVLYNADCLDVLPGIATGSVDAVVVDPPYGLEFMGKDWDKLDWRLTAGFSQGGSERFGNSPPLPSFGGPTSENRICRACKGTERGQDRKGFHRCRCETPDFPESAYRPSDSGQAMQAWHFRWAGVVLRVLKPGGYLLSFGGTRTFHRLACALEDAGFELRDTLCWLYGQGYPKAKSCLKPAWEPIILARKPGRGVAPLSIDECRIPVSDDAYAKNCSGDRGHADNRTRDMGFAMGCGSAHDAGRWPANVILDEEAGTILDAQAGPQKSGGTPKRRPPDKTRNVYQGRFGGQESPKGIGGSEGNVSRFFYCPKANKADRGEGNTHPTVKPTALMEWLVKLVTRPGDTVLDCFGGSGSTGKACIRTGRKAVLIEQDQEQGYFGIGVARLELEWLAAKQDLFPTGAD